ncbi:ABC-type transporter Mla MlaB component [Luteimonas cucumeris]|uniref:ABC-type transporter Mla MlaB component n=1 Tax=Luteimonas cucumeris TaxID=985012 RepID=A0A562L5M6_9GAMM|nr:STAS domain-containing protein [Luteimonas cucumeris]TWI02816.1 ABC-type transporter Mla MlaB component [Luteimonas cucumeris]
MSAVLLGDDLGIEAAAELKQQLAAHLAQPQPLALDAGAVQRVHTACVQVLCTFFRERRQAGRDTGFAAASTSLRDAARLLGVTEPLGLAHTDHQSAGAHAA